jgi:hypothetical protein
MIVVLALMAWRFVLTGLRRRPLARAIAARQEQQNHVLEYGRHILDRAGLAVAAGNRFANRSHRVDRVATEERAETYLRRMVALTGAIKMGNTYVLYVGNTRFHVRDRYVTRLRDVTDPKSAHEETCFYSVHNGIPKAEEIATALLQLANNPGLFDKWAVQNGLAFKADGQVFSRAQ